MVADDEVTITVRRETLEWVLGAARTHPGAITRARVDEIEAAIPPPPWEPSDEQIKAYCEAWSWSARNRLHAIDGLRKLHAAGLVLP